MEADPDPLHGLLIDVVRLIGLLHPEMGNGADTLPLSQAFALHELDTDVALSQRDLASRLLLEKSTVSRLVADMERDGLVVRERDPDNRRYYRLRLTDRGRKAHATMAASVHDRYVQLTAGLTRAERKALLTGLPALVRVLREGVG